MEERYLQEVQGEGVSVVKIFRHAFVSGYLVWALLNTLDLNGDLLGIITKVLATLRVP